MKRALIAAVLAGTFVIPAFADDVSTSQKGSGQNIALKKAEILQHIDQRIASSQEEKSCVQSATTRDDIKACRDKYRPKPRGDRQE